MNLPEIIFGSSDAQASRTIARQVKAGQLKKIANRLYTSNLHDTPEEIVRRNLYYILGHLYPNAILSHRSAQEGGLTKEYSIFLTYKYTKKISLPGVTVHLLQGPGPAEGDMPFMGGLYISSRARALLENMQHSRSRQGLPKVLSQQDIENHLDSLCSTQGEVALNRLRDQARDLCKVLGMAAEFDRLDKLIGAVLGTREARHLISERTQARAQGVPFDSHRVALFSELYGALRRQVLPVFNPIDSTPDYTRHLAFFEAYFSNYIEGTEFEIEEAADIVFHNKILPQRPADSHDIIETYQIVSNTQEMTRIPASPDELMTLLRSRHAQLMSARPAKQPGQFKNKINRAGDTVFVAPELVTGTLIKGFEIYQAIEDPLARALFMMFLVSEVHPFTDGNGRIARVMMNAELVNKGRSRIIVPTVYREDYLLALRALSRQGHTDPYIRMLTRAQAFTSCIDFNDYEIALGVLRQCNAFREPHEGLLKMPENVFSSGNDAGF